jgi:hypothetical protein
MTGITPKFTTGVISHNKVLKAGATILEGCTGQVILNGTTAIPQAAFAATTGGTTQIVTCTTTVNSTRVTMTSTATLAVGMMVSGVGITFLSAFAAIYKN